MQKIYNPFAVKSIPYVHCVFKAQLQSENTVKEYGYDIDAGKYIAISRSPEHRKLIYSTLPKAARDLFFLIPLCLNEDYQYVILTREKKDEIMGTTSNSRIFNEAIKELIQYTIIDYKDKLKGEYWINHEFFHYGSRLRMFPNNLVRVATVPVKPREV